MKVKRRNNKLVFGIWIWIGIRKQRNGTCLPSMYPRFLLPPETMPFNFTLLSRVLFLSSNRFNSVNLPFCLGWVIIINLFEIWSCLLIMNMIMMFGINSIDNFTIIQVISFHLHCLRSFLPFTILKLKSITLRKPYIQLVWSWYGIVWYAYPNLFHFLPFVSL